MPIKTRRWNDLPEGDEGFRLLVCRYRPRGVAKADESWDAWDPDLGPSKTLHREYFPESGSPISWPQYRVRYLAEQKANQGKIAQLAKRYRADETITLICSSHCTRESRCHRSLLKELIESAAAETNTARPDENVK